MVDDKRLEYLESIYQDKCCITQNDKDIQSIIKELIEYRAIGTVEKLKELRDFKATYQKGMDYSYAIFKYKKAIDDFADKIATYFTCDDYGNVIDVLEIAEELKKEGAE